jgi:lysophospholipase L1-like esterase
MRIRLLALLSALTLFVLAAVPASATSEGHSYLALGDSVPFGFSPLVNPNDASNFVGYPEIVAQRLNIDDVNAACPGEATGGFLSLTGTDNGCRAFRFFFNAPLHVEYAGTQIDFALGYLRSHHNTRLVTLMLGANDVFVFQRSHPECFGLAPPPACAALTAVVFGTIQANLSTIFSELRSTGYTGLIVALTYYALNYAIPAFRDGAIALNMQMILAANADSHDVLVASGFDAWEATALAPPANGDPCLAGLRILTPSGCNVHPTLFGHELLAGAIVQTIADSCPAQSAIGCLNRNQA